MQQGFSRVLKGGEVNRIEDIIDLVDENAKPENCFLVIDRVRVDYNDDDFKSRVGDSAQIAYYEGKGNCIISYNLNGKDTTASFSNKFELDGIVFEEPSVNMFAFNNPLGACKRCEGFGNIIGIDPELVIPNPSLSVLTKQLHAGKAKK